MKFSSGKPAHWVGTLMPDRSYDAGAVGVRKGIVKVSRLDDNSYASDAWAELGPMGASPTRVMHKWFPQVCLYPAGDEGEMSDPTEVCGDCWKDADYKNAFRPDLHLYVIRELGRELGL